MSPSSIKLSTGHTVEYFKDYNKERFHKVFPTYGDMIRIQPGGWFFEECMPPILERIYNFQFKSTDVITMTFPKSGASLSQEVLWTILQNPNLNNPAAKIPLDYRSTKICSDLFFKIKHGPKLEIELEKMVKNAIQQVDPDRVNDEYPILTYTDLCLKHSRVIKTNLPLPLLPPTVLENSKIVYVARNPRDVIILRYNMFKVMKSHNYQGTFDEYLDHFFSDELFYNPYWQHLKEAWDQRHHPNLLFILYEDMLTEPFREYSKINEFLGLNLTETQVKNIVEYCRVESMKKLNGTLELMCDEGQANAGDQINKYSPEQEEKINNWIKKSTKDFPKDFPYLVEE